MFFAVAIMLVSFLPVFALGGIEGRMFRPLAYTKSFALLAVALLTVTLVPALCTVFVRGRIRSEEASPLVRGVTRVYRPVLALVPRPAGRDRLGRRGHVRRRGGRDRRRAGCSWARWPAVVAGLWLSSANGEPGRAVRPALVFVGAGRRAKHHPARAGVPDPAGRGDGDGHADHRPAGVDHAVDRRPEGPRHGPLPVPGGGHGRRQGRPGRDARPTRPRST